MDDAHAAKTALLSRIEEAASGLLYPSESDVPLTPFVFTGPAGAEPAPEALLLAEGRAPGAPVEKVSLEDFFTPLMEERKGEDPTEAKRFRALFDLLKGELADIRVLRVGSPEVAIYVLGKQPSGQWIGLKTKAVET